MASMEGGVLDREKLSRSVNSRGMINRVLQDICLAEGLSKAGVKSDLQARINERINLYYNTNNVSAFRRLERIIKDPSTAASMAGGSARTPSTSGGHMGTPGSANSNSGGSGAIRGYGPPKIEFKASPYYVIEQQIGSTVACDVMQHHRFTAKIPLSAASYPILNRVPEEENLKVMVFCVNDGSGPQDIAFPHQCELKVNSFEIKANLRGLKNKPGSTRPADITKDLRFTPVNYNGNYVELTYALTSKKFWLAVNVVRTIPVETLVEKIADGKRITEKTVIADMVNKAKDTDIVATASVLSLKCPLSTLRIDLPCRSTACRHIQCFDATSYLQLQEQGPTWSCPICNNPAAFDTLAVDEYVKAILEKTSKSVDQVTIQPDGKWELHTKKEASSRSTPMNHGGDDSDDEILEITKTGDTVRVPTLKTNSQFRSTAPIPNLSRQASQSAGSITGKRPISAVIDLTSSGDEDDEPPARAPKRQYITPHSNGPPASIPTFRPAPAA